MRHWLQARGWPCKVPMTSIVPRLTARSPTICLPAVSAATTEYSVCAVRMPFHSHVAQRSNGQVRVGGPPTAGLVTTWCAVAHCCRPPLSVHAAHTQRYSVQSNQGRSLFAQRRNCHRRRRFCAKAARPLGPGLPLLSSPHLCSSPLRYYDCSVNVSFTSCLCRLCQFHC